MKLNRQILSTPFENVAFDESLLNWAEEKGGNAQFLRIWESPQTAIVIGRSSKAAVEVNLERCRDLGVPVIRRVSGGAAVALGPGCLMYALVLSGEIYPETKLIDHAHAFVMERLCRCLNKRGVEVTFQGSCDLTFKNKKFSGNSMRMSRSHILYHGTLLYDFPIEEIGNLLGTPPRQPDYRQRRSHGEFVTNLPLNRSELEAALIDEFQPEEFDESLPLDETNRLVEEKYSRDEWNFRH